MAFNIESFKSNLSGYGYLRNNLFDVNIAPPPILLGKSQSNVGTPSSINEIMQNITMRVEQVRAPGIALMSSEINRYGIGPTQKQPFNAMFSETTLSILSDGYGENWQFWTNWIKAIFDFNGTDSARSGQASRLPTYTAEYKDNYATVMQIVIYDMYGNTIQRINLYDAFPTSIREVPLAWSDNQSLLRLAVSITYSEYTIVGTALEDFQKQQSENLRFSSTIGNRVST